MDRSKRGREGVREYEEERGKRCGEWVCASLVGTVQYVVSRCVRH